MNYYEILKVKQTASKETIKNAYKKLIKKYHPDIYKGDKTFAEQMTKELNIAYDTLSVPELRKEYDILISPPSPSTIIATEDLSKNATSASSATTNNSSQNNSSSSDYNYTDTGYRPKSFDNESYYKNFYKTSTTTSYQNNYSSEEDNLSHSENTSSTSHEDNDKKIYDDYMRNYNARHNIKTEPKKEVYKDTSLEKRFAILLPLAIIIIAYIMYCVYFVDNLKSTYGEKDTTTSSPIHDYDTSNSDYYQNPNYKPDGTPINPSTKPSSKPSKPNTTKPNTNKEDSTPSGNPSTVTKPPRLDDNNNNDDDNNEGDTSFYNPQDKNKVNPKEETLLKYYSKDALMNSYYKILDSNNFTQKDLPYEDFIDLVYNKLKKNEDI